MKRHMAKSQSMPYCEPLGNGDVKCYNESWDPETQQFSLYPEGYTVEHEEESLAQSVPAVGSAGDFNPNVYSSANHDCDGNPKETSLPGDWFGSHLVGSFAQHKDDPIVGSLKEFEPSTYSSYEPCAGKRLPGDWFANGLRSEE